MIIRWASKLLLFECNFKGIKKHVAQKMLFYKAFRC